MLCGGNCFFCASLNDFLGTEYAMDVSCRMSRNMRSDVCTMMEFCHNKFISAVTEYGGRWRKKNHKECIWNICDFSIRLNKPFCFCFNLNSQFASKMFQCVFAVEFLQTEHQCYITSCIIRYNSFERTSRCWYSSLHNNIERFKEQGMRHLNDVNHKINHFHKARENPQ